MKTKFRRYVIRALTDVTWTEEDFVETPFENDFDKFFEGLSDDDVYNWISDERVGDLKLSIVEIVEGYIEDGEEHITKRTKVNRHLGW
ncbi:hypothetical protein DRQ26_05280 [bacterium]|nr:MAG: hypothetical protein DRQ26_05280 [bacterium]